MEELQELKNFLKRYEMWIVLVLLLIFFVLTIYLMLTFNPLSLFAGLGFGYFLSRSKRYKYPFEKQK